MIEFWTLEERLVSLGITKLGWNILAYGTGENRCGSPSLESLIVLLFKIMNRPIIKQKDAKSSFMPFRYLASLFEVSETTGTILLL